MAESYIGSPNHTKGRQGQKIQFVIIHWIVGNLASADAVFQNPHRNTSAHKGIEDDTVHVYVRDADTAYHAGNWDMNTRSLGYEHSAEPGRLASDATYETSAKYVADACKRYGIPLDRQHIKRHGEVVPTQCCGTIDVERIIRRAAELVGTPLPQVPLAQPAIPIGDNVVNWHGTVTAISNCNVRAYPNTSAPLSGSRQVEKGKTFNVVGYTVAQDPYGTGQNIWLKSEYGNWVWAGNTSFNLGGAPNPVAHGGRVVITASPYLYVRSEPKRSAPLRGSQVLYPGTIVDYAQEVSGETINGNNIWYKSLYGNYFWSGGCRKY